MRKIIIIAISLFVYSLYMEAADLKKITIDSSNTKTIQALKKMQSSIKNKTAQGHEYSMYAIKTRRDWEFIVMDSLSVYTVKLDKTSNQMIEMDENYTEALYLSIKSKSLKKIEKRYTIAGTEIDCYYRIKLNAAILLTSMKKKWKKAKGIMGDAKKGSGKAKKINPKMKFKMR